VSSLDRIHQTHKPASGHVAAAQGAFLRGLLVRQRSSLPAPMSVLLKGET
jgi:hypothetical protein